jgi:hypothetical protein
MRFDSCLLLSSATDYIRRCGISHVTNVQARDVLLPTPLSLLLDYP